MDKPEITTEQRVAHEELKKAKMTKLRSDHSTEMQDLHKLPFSKENIQKITDVTHKYTVAVARILSN